MTTRRPRTQCTHKKQCISKLCGDCKEGLGSSDHFTEKPKKQPLTPLIFHALPQAQRLQQLALIYMARCTTDGFTKAGLFKLSRYFATIDPQHVQCFFDYIYGMSENAEVNLYDIYDKSRAWQLNLRLTANKPTAEVAQYPSLLDCLNGL